MNRWMAIGLATALVLVTPATVRGQHGNGASNKHATTTHGSSATSHGGSTHVKSSSHQSTHGSSTHAAKPSHGSSTHGSSGKTTTKTTKTTKTTTTSTSTTTTTTLTPVQQKLQKNTKLASKLQSRLPEGTDVMKAAKGFRNLGQFVAAVNVSNNLGIPFNKLKAAMVDDGLSLGQAIQKLKGDADADTEAKHAEQEAETEIRQTSTSTGNSTTTLTPVQQKLQKNTKLASKLRSRLPEGTDLMKAAAGFRNFGQFVAAVNVSHNLGIPFADLKTKMVTDGMSLGQAIQTLRPAANATTEVEQAEHEADDLIRQTTTTTTSATTKKRQHS
jgi:hypothetical protein